MDMNLNDMLVLFVVGMGVVMVTLTLLMFFVMFISKIINQPKTEKVISPLPSVPVSAPAVTAAPEQTVYTPSEGLQLIGTDEKTAAMVMAVVSDSTGIPLSRLQFKSIRFLLSDADDKTTATIMAIISDTTKIPLSKLDFKSIRVMNH